MINAKKDTVKSIAQAVDIIEAISDNKEPMSLSDIVKATDLNKATVFRALNTLNECRWLKKVGDRWALGLPIAALWARYKTALEADIQTMQDEHEKLEVDGG